MTLVRIGFRLIHLVDGYNDRNTRRLGMVDRFNGLRHDAVVRRDNQNRDIGAPVAPRARMEVNAAWPGVSRKVIGLAVDICT